jgi:selenide,water dikinase
MMDSKEIKLTSFTKGGGCGCKIPPSTLKEILKGQHSSQEFGLIVGNSGGDDAAVWEIGDGLCMISTTDFFTPIVDDPFDFGRIAAANSISDVYAMGGKPVMALSILGWPTDKLSTEVAAEVLRGARKICEQAGIAIGGGHSIENPEPVFGLAVNGLIQKNEIKRNNTVKKGDILYLTKPLGSGILTTAMKRNLLTEGQIDSLIDELVELNRVGEKLAKNNGVHAMTDVTGFGLIGHLLEMTANGNISARIKYDQVPLMNNVRGFAAQFVYADNTMRNWKAFNEKVVGISGESLLTLCDPQTNGGLLVAVERGKCKEIEVVFREEGQFFWEIGWVEEKGEHQIIVE